MKYKINLLGSSVAIIILVSVAVIYYSTNKLSAADILKKSAFITSQNMDVFSFVASSTGNVIKVDGDSKIPDAILSVSTSTYSVLVNGFVTKTYSSTTNITFELSLNADGEDAISTNSAKLGADFIFVDGSSYIRLSDFSANVSFKDPKMNRGQLLIAMYNGMASTIKNKWIDISDRIATDTASSSSKENGKMAADYFATTDLLKSPEFINDNLRDQNGNSTYHIRTRIQDSGKLMTLLKNIGDKKFATDMNQKVKFDYSVDQLSSILQRGFYVDLWITKKDWKIYRVLIPDIEFEESAANIKSTGTFDLRLVDYGKMKSLSAPKDAVTYQELINNIFGDLFDTGVSSRVSASLESDSTLASKYQHIDETTTYKSKNFNFIIKYPTHWDWTTRITNEPSIPDEGLWFTLQSPFLKGPNRVAYMSFDAQSNYRSDWTIDDAFESLKTSLSEVTRTNEKSDIIPPNWPKDFESKALEIDAYTPIVDGTRMHIKELVVLIRHGNVFYHFVMYTDPNDYEMIYPLAVSILRSITFK